MYCLVTPEFRELLQKAWEKSAYQTVGDLERILSLSPTTIARILRKKVSRIRSDRMDTLRTWIQNTLGMAEMEMPAKTYFGGKVGGNKSPGVSKSYRKRNIPMEVKLHPGRKLVLETKDYTITIY